MGRLGSHDFVRERFLIQGQEEQMVRLRSQCGGPPWVWVRTFSHILCPLITMRSLQLPGPRQQASSAQSIGNRELTGFQISRSLISLVSSRSSSVLI